MNNAKELIPKRFLFSHIRLFCRSTSLFPLILSTWVFPKAFPYLFCRGISNTCKYSGRPYSRFVGSVSATSFQSAANIESSSMHQELSFVDAEVAKLIDDRLMSQPGYSIDQLMELAGYSVACAAHDILSSAQSPSKTVYVFCGPGNNGGDGLVAARHLFHFGFSPMVIYPKQSSGVLFTNLVNQLDGLSVPVLREPPTTEELLSSALIIDGLFGFSFKGPSREPFTSIIAQLQSIQHQVSILSIDLPSGWDVNLGDVHETGFNPSATISLTLPKLCMSSYLGIHYVGGRFMPPSLASELKLTMPDYGNSVSQFVKLSSSTSQSKKGVATTNDVDVNDKIVAMYTTAPTITEAKTISQYLVTEKLAACVNIMPNIQSVYEWEGKVEESAEFLLMIKTRKSLASSVTSAIKNMHSYDLPESIVVDIGTEGSNSAYLDWVRHSTTAPK